MDGCAAEQGLQDVIALSLVPSLIGQCAAERGLQDVIGDESETRRPRRTRRTQKLRVAYAQLTRKMVFFCIFDQGHTWL